ncbi:MAG: sigma-54 dependent transcriptional regulator [Desulfosarcinaceae bacterium]|nr:sigma-54 dependent transcriptional regulator [Desulfosarcinaceae bacterium]
MPEPHPSLQNCNILFVDDDRQILELVQQFLLHRGIHVTITPAASEALQMVAETPYDVVFSDLMMPEMDGLELLKAIKATRSNTEVVIVTGHGSIETAIQALKLGGYDYLQKPINFDRLTILLERIWENKRLKEENVFIKERLKDRYKYDELVGISPRMQQVYEIIDRISMGAPTVLIQGESGTGKELVANVIHRNSQRRHKPFIPVNCGAISEHLLESELFGHIKGAFSGAIRDTVGLFKAADGGTLFLDEIAEIPPSLQVKLLRALQEQRIRRVGDVSELPVNVRVIAATNKILEDEIESQRFRKDLYYRLNVIAIHMPALREIKEDVPFLIHHFIRRFSRKNANRVLNVSQEAMDILIKYQWPGNVRELENVIERAYALCVGDTIAPADLPPEIQNFGETLSVGETNFNLKDNEIRLIRKALQRTQGNKAETARLLGINLSTVYRKMDKYGIQSPA